MLLQRIVTWSNLIEFIFKLLPNISQHKSDAFSILKDTARVQVTGPTHFSKYILSYQYLDYHNCLLALYIKCCSCCSLVQAQVSVWQNALSCGADAHYDRVPPGIFAIIPKLLCKLYTCHLCENSLYCI